MVTIHDGTFVLPDRVYYTLTNLGTKYYIGNELISSGNLRLYLSHSYPEEVDAPKIVDWGKKFFDQGASYAFDGHDVSHLKLVGDVYPTGLYKLGDYWLTKMPTGNDSIMWISGNGIYRNTHPGSYTRTTTVWRTLQVQGNDVLLVASENLFSTGNVKKRLRFYAYELNVLDSRNRFRQFCTPIVEYTVYGNKDKEDRFRDFLRTFHSVTADQLTFYGYAGSSVPLSTGTIDVSTYQIRRRGAALLNRMWDSNIMSLISNEHESELIRECLEGQRKLTVNMLNWVDKLTSWGGGIKAILDLTDNFNPKTVASAWLSNRFGDRLEYQSSLDVLDALWDQFLTVPFPNKYQGTSVSRARWKGEVAGGYLSTNMRLVVSNQSYTSLMSSIKGLMEWGIWPSTVNTFDLIPFSFVLDWFTNLSTILGNVDALVYRQYLKVLLCERSWRFTLPTPSVTEGMHCRSDIHIIWYVRRGTTKLPEFGILEGWEPSLPSLVNIVDSASLLVQLFG